MRRVTRNVPPLPGKSRASFRQREAGGSPSGETIKIAAHRKLQPAPKATPWTADDRRAQENWAKPANT